MSLATISHSRASCYLECGHKYRLLYIDRVGEAERSYFSLGRSVHFSVEAYGRQQLSGGPPLTERELIDALNAKWVRGGYRTEMEERLAYDEAVSMVKLYRQDQIRMPRRPIAIELELTAKIEGLSVPIHGILDRVDANDDGTVTVRDFKTSKKLGPSDAANSNQLTLYQALFEATHPGVRVSTLELHALRSGRVYSTPARSKDRVEALISSLQSVVNGILAGEFDPRPGSQCGRCDFRYDGRCPAWPRDPGFVALI